MVFDLPYKDIILRVRMSKTGIRLWKRSTGNLDAPRAYDPFIAVDWDKVALAGTCFAGSQSGHYERGPASGRAGLNYLTKAKVRKTRKSVEEEPINVQTGTPTKT